MIIGGFPDPTIPSRPWRAAAAVDADNAATRPEQHVDELRRQAVPDWW